MADVRRLVSVRPDGESRGTRSRGQLILVTALSLAILFVALALILNTAIYTENLATRSGDIGGATDAVRYHDAARDAVTGIIEYANTYNSTNHSTLNTSVEGGIVTFRNYSARQFAAGDRAVETTLDFTVTGTRIAQTDANRNFTNSSGTAADWTVVTGVEHSRIVTLNVTDDTFLADAGTGSEFELVLQGGGGNTWRLNVTSDGTDTTIGIKNGSSVHFTCSGSDKPLINLTAGTVGGEPCMGLAFAEGIDAPYDISIVNGDHINGTYSMVVDNESLAVNVAANDDLVADGAGQPFADHAIYSANVTVVYETSRLYYNTTVRVAPGEPDG